MDRIIPFQKDPEKLTTLSDSYRAVAVKAVILVSTGMKTCLRLHFISHKETHVLASTV